MKRIREIIATTNQLFIYLYLYARWVVRELAESSFVRTLLWRRVQASSEIHESNLWADPHLLEPTFGLELRGQFIAFPSPLLRTLTAIGQVKSLSHRPTIQQRCLQAVCSCTSKLQRALMVQLIPVGFFADQTFAIQSWQSIKCLLLLVLIPI